jgi:flagellar basal body-associated protein FliL
MGKKPKKQVQAGREGAERKPRGNKSLLVAAMFMCAASLGGGFFLARMAYLQDSAAYAPDYETSQKDGAGKDDEAEEATAMNKVTDPLAKGDHPAQHAMALQDDTSTYSDDYANNGIVDFGEIMTNIQALDPNGVPTRAFLKVSLVMAYRKDEGSSELIKTREPFIRDLFNGYLRGLTEADVRGMIGLLTVKSELLKRARAAVGNDMPQEVLIKDLIVQ